MQHILHVVCNAELHEADSPHHKSVLMGYIRYVLFRILPFLIIGCTCLTIIITFWYEKKVVYNFVFRSNEITQNREHLELEIKPDEKVTLERLSKLLVSSIDRVQNPSDCNNAKTLVCNLSRLNSQDFGLILHAVIACHLMAYGLGRVVLIEENRKFPFRESLSELLLPADSKCGNNAKTTASGINMKTNSIWSDMITLKDHVQVVTYFVEYKHISGPFPIFVPGTMPANLRQRLSGLHREPDAWFLGHFAKYHLSRMQPLFAKKLSMLQEGLKFKLPVVGVYLNTKTSANGSMYASDADFINEIKNNVGFQPSAVGVLVKTGTSRSGAIYVPEKEYIHEADIFFSRYHGDAKQHQIFLSTDDADLESYYNKQFGNKFIFLQLPQNLKQFGHEETSRGFTKKFIHSLITELHLLVKADYVICTFSSHICRLVYELKQASSDKDASNEVLSLDYSWGYEQPGYSWSPDLSILAMALHNGHSVDKNHVPYSEGEMFDLFSWSSHDESKGINVIAVRQRNVKKPQIGRVPAKDFRILVNINDEPPYVENDVFA